MYNNLRDACYKYKKQIPLKVQYYTVLFDFLCFYFAM
jgi:hypothetical protein